MVVGREILGEHLRDSKGRFLDVEDQGICIVMAAKYVGKCQLIYVFLFNRDWTV